MSKILGKISDFKFGITGYNDACLGYSVTFSLDGGNSGISDSKGAWDFNRIKHTNGCTWSEEDREIQLVETLKRLSDILRDAKVKTVNQLINIPVEVTVEGNTLKSWRVLTEVL